MASATPLSVAQARARILAGVQPVSAELVPLADAVGRTLAEGMAAKLTQPPFDASAMDGYAVRASDQVRAMRVVGEAAAGHPFGTPLKPGEAVRIFTGAPLPEGADTVLIQENADVKDGVLRATVSAETGSYVRPAGGDFSAGAQGLAAGTLLGAHHIGLIAAMGHDRVSVRRRPVVALLATGDELVRPGETPGPGQIVASNGVALASLMQQCGAQGQNLGIARDTLEDLATHLARAHDADVLVTIGGASVGDHDLVQPALRDFGVEMDFWKIAMRPGKPLMFGTRTLADGTRAQQRVIGLPGNPVSSLVCGRVFVVPLILAMLGRASLGEEPERLPLAGTMPANGPREHYMRGRIVTASDGRRRVMVHDRQDSSLLSVLTQSDVLVIAEPHAPVRREGDLVPVLPLGL